ncbi:amino acid permease family protein [Ophiocordyceps camponoti-floridani]|uniref:Amino acid permease family protein n=1 Tax=Ophiocordyceps camponoti-floridani TaxID=2030778 RepID=A0A8H4QBF0_9HYPO|nr:amino acid permease family protein [Ophiocordyceps camponoti-floridani]
MPSPETIARSSDEATRRRKGRRRSTNDGDSQIQRDASDLAALGHPQALTRKFTLWSILALALCVLGTWTTFAQGLSSGLVHGGPVAILWGLVLVALCNGCVAVSLGELCSSMPTALGQADWISRLASSSSSPSFSPHPSAARFASYLCAWLNTFGWWTLGASQVAFMTDFGLSLHLIFIQDDAAAAEARDGLPPWRRLLVYLAITLLFTLVNLLSCRRDELLPSISNWVGIGFVALFIAFIVALPVAVAVRPGLNFQPAKFVFSGWINRTGWPDGVTWFAGLVQSAYGLTAFDSVIHMAEEMPAPRRNVPLTMWLAVASGAISGFIFMLVCLFCIQDVERLLSPPSGFPFIEISQSTLGRDAAAVLIALFIVNGLGQGVGILTSASRLTWSFARDGGLPLSRYWSLVDARWRVPARALWLQAGLISLIGLLYLFANTVLQAVLSVSTIALTLSYAMPIAALVIFGREALPPGDFRLGPRFGPLANAVSLAYCAVTTVFFFFPSSPSPAPGDMNYAIAVFGLMVVVALGFWLFEGRKSYMRTSSGGDADVLYAQDPDGVSTVMADDVNVKRPMGKKL